MTKPTLTDRERILSLIIRELATSAILCPHGYIYDESTWKGSGSLSDRTYVHFARYRKPVRGDLVIGDTGMMRGPHEWSIGFYVQPLDSSIGGAIIREIGSERLCNYSNEEFTPIVGLTKTQLLEGARYEVYNKVLAAFGRGGEYSYRFGGIDFEGDILIIWVREVFGGSPSNPSKPFKITTKWRKNMSVKAILAAMREQGYGTKEFEPDETAKKVTGPSIQVEMGKDTMTVVKTHD